MLHQQLLTSLLNQAALTKSSYPLKLTDPYQNLSYLNINQVKTSPEPSASKVLIENLAQSTIQKKIKTNMEVLNLLQAEEKLRTLQTPQIPLNTQMNPSLPQMSIFHPNQFPYPQKPMGFSLAGANLLKTLLMSQLNSSPAITQSQPVILQKISPEDALDKPEAKSLAKTASSPTKQCDILSVSTNAELNNSPSKRTASVRDINEHRERSSKSLKTQSSIEEEAEQEEEPEEEEEIRITKKDDNFKVRLTGNSKNQPLRKQPQRVRKTAEEKLSKETELEIILSMMPDIVRLVGYSDVDHEKLYILWQRSDSDQTRFLIKLKRNLSYYKKTLKIAN